MNGIPRSVLLYGLDETPDEPIGVRAGPLRMSFDPNLAFLRYVRLADREVLRGVYAVVRDRNWDTIPSEVSNLELEDFGDSFRLTFDVECREREVDFFWQGKIMGDAEGSVTFDMEGVARSAFLRNRIGFCVLHPMEVCKGRPCVVEKTDGSSESGCFPPFISPHQPFTDIRAITYEVLPGVSAEVHLEGDAFEMEDQRNWTDASFKTYCTPLDLPFPVKVEEGERVRQRVYLKVRTRARNSISSPWKPPSEVLLTIDQEPSVRMPQLGLVLGRRAEFLGERERALLRALNLSHLRVDLHLQEAGWERTLTLACTEAEHLGLGLEVALFVDDVRRLHRLVRKLDQTKPNIARWLVFGSVDRFTDKELLGTARQVLMGYDAGAEFGAGTDAYFAELNRGRPPLEYADLLCYSVNPQVHAFDNASLVETLAGQAETVESARRLGRGRPVCVTPVTFAPRFNPNAAEPETATHMPLNRADPRQLSLFGAGWTLGSVKHLAESGAHCLTYYEVVGRLGVMQVGAPTDDEVRLRPLQGVVFPLYHVFADVGGLHGGSVVRSNSTAPLEVECLALRKGQNTRILVANLGPRSRRVRIEHAGWGGSAQVKLLDETNIERAMYHPETFLAGSGVLQQTGHDRTDLCLRPYALARVDTLTG